MSEKIRRRLLCGSLLFLGAVPPVWAQTEEPPQQPVVSPLAIEPTTIDGNYEAALLMAKLARPELVRHYLDQILAMNPSDDDLLALRDAHGTGSLMELARVAGPDSAASQILERITNAVDTRSDQIEYVESLLPKLTGSPREQASAQSELRHLGSHAIPALLRNLDNPTGPGADLLMATMAQIGRPAIPPLIAAVSTSPDDNVKASAARVLGAIGSKSEMSYLWYPAFGEDQSAGVQDAAQRALLQIKYGSRANSNRISQAGAAEQLKKAAIDLLTGNDEPSDTPGAPQTFWSWDDTLGTVRQTTADPVQVKYYLAEMRARQAALLAPDDDMAPVLVLTSKLAREVEANGWQLQTPQQGPGSLSLLATATGSDINERVLQFALDHEVPAAALGSIQALAVNGSPDLLKRPRNGSPIINALDAPHPRIQFAAAIAILQWEPLEKFRGSRRVVEILARTLNAGTQAAGVVMDPNISRASATAGLFGELGYRSEIAPTGKEGFLLASERGNVELAVLHPNVIRWELSQTLANLRSDARTASLPVVIYGPEAVRQGVDHVVQQYRNVVFIPESVSALDINHDLEPVLAALSPPPVTAQQRETQMAQAAFWLHRIASSQMVSVFDLSEAERAIAKAANDPKLQARALVTLGAIGRPSVQSALAITVTAPVQDVQIRSLAAQVLAHHIQRYGTLLSNTQLQEIEQMWSTTNDPQIKMALSGVIGVLGPPPAATRKQLLSQPPRPPVPTGNDPAEAAPSDAVPPTL